MFSKLTLSKADTHGRGNGTLEELFMSTIPSNEHFFECIHAHLWYLMHKTIRLTVYLFSCWSLIVEICKNTIAVFCSTTLSVLGKYYDHWCHPLQEWVASCWFVIVLSKDLWSVQLQLACFLIFPLHFYGTKPPTILQNCFCFSFLVNF
jgi:hypothetical protein